MLTLLIDNDDSFTWNLSQQIESLQSRCIVLRQDEVSLSDIRRLKPDRIVLSPGPGSPRNVEGSCMILKDSTFKVPLLGVCLGHQCIAHVFDSPKAVVRAPSLLHGKTSEIFHTGESIFRGVTSPFSGARYHSLCIKRVPPGFKLLAWTGSEDRPKVIMGIRHESRPIVGIQFHPESFLTEQGNIIMKNFLYGPW